MSKQRNRFRTSSTLSGEKVQLTKTQTNHPNSKFPTGNNGYVDGVRAKEERKAELIAERREKAKNSPVPLERMFGLAGNLPKIKDEEEAHRRTWDNDGHPLYEALKMAGKDTRVVEIEVDKEANRDERLNHLISGVKSAMQRLEAAIKNARS